MPSVSFDNVAISENYRKLHLLKLISKWNDLGTLESMWNLDKTTNQRSPIKKSQGMVVTHNVKNSILILMLKTVAIDLKIS